MSLVTFTAVTAVLTHQKSGLVLDLCGGGVENGTGVLLWGAHGGANQQWGLSAAPGEGGGGGDFFVVCAGAACGSGSGKLVLDVDVRGGGGGGVHAWGCHGGMNQRWVLRRVAAGGAGAGAGARGEGGVEAYHLQCRAPGYEGLVLQPEKEAKEGVGLCLRQHREGDTDQQWVLRFK